MINDLLVRMASGTIFYELENETNESLNIETFEQCIKFYDLLCNGNKNAIDRIISAINADDDYFYEADVVKFLEKYRGGE